MDCFMSPATKYLRCAMFLIRRFDRLNCGDLVNINGGTSRATARRSRRSHRIQIVGGKSEECPENKTTSFCHQHLGTSAGLAASIVTSHAARPILRTKQGPVSLEDYRGNSSSCYKVQIEYKELDTTIRTGYSVR